MKLQEVTNYNLKSQTILNESWNVLTESQRLHVGAWEKRVWPLMEQLNTLLEAQLTADQIQQIFANAEKVSIEGGANLTALGKAGKVTAEVSSKMKAEIDKLLKQAADSEPVQNMDAQFDKLRTELANKVRSIKGGDKILAGVDKWRQFAEQNPGKSAFIIGAMTSLLAFASGGIMSGAAIGFFLRLANNAIQGDKLSTAVGKATKTAALGAVAGAFGDALDSVVGDSVEVVEPDVEGGAAEVTATISSDDVNSKLPDETAQSLEQDPETVEQELSLEGFKQVMAREILQDRADQFNTEVTPEMVNKLADNIEVTGDYPNNYEATMDGTFVRGTVYLTPDEAQEYSQIVQRNGGGLNGHFSEEANEFIRNISGQEEESELDFDQDDETKDAVSLNKESLEDQLWNNFALYETNFQEGPIGDAAKGFARSLGGVAAAGAKSVGKGIAGAAKKGASAVGKELGQKITVRKLNKLWKEAGSPTDTGSIANILSQAGMNDQQIGTVAQSNNVDLKKTATNQQSNQVAGVDIKSLADQIKKAGLAPQIKQMLV